MYIHTQTEANGGGGGGIRWIFPAAADHLLIFQVPFFKPTMTMTTREITLSVTIRYRLLLPCYFILLHPQIAKEKKKRGKRKKSCVPVLRWKKPASRSLCCAARVVVVGGAAAAAVGKVNKDDVAEIRRQRERKRERGKTEQSNTTFGRGGGTSQSRPGENQNRFLSLKNKKWATGKDRWRP